MLTPQEINRLIGRRIVADFNEEGDPIWYPLTDNTPALALFCSNRQAMQTATDYLWLCSRDMFQDFIAILVKLVQREWDEKGIAIAVTEAEPMLQAEAFLRLWNDWEGDPLP